MVLNKQQAVVLVLGGPDTGKTTLVHTLYGQLGGSIIDADLGQSAIGPPACVSVGVPGSAKESFFVGDISPRGCWERVVKGVVYCLGRAQRPCLIDTDGYLEGEEAQVYKSALIEAVRPDVLVLLSRGELDKFKRFESTQLKVIELPAQGVGRKPLARRIWSREEAFRHYFALAQLRRWDRNQLAAQSALSNDLRDRLIGLSWQGRFAGLGVLKNVTEESLEIATPVEQADSLELGCLYLYDDGAHRRIH